MHVLQPSLQRHNCMYHPNKYRGRTGMRFPNTTLHGMPDYPEKILHCQHLFMQELLHASLVRMSKIVTSKSDAGGAA